MTFTAEQVMEKVRALAKARPEFKYNDQPERDGAPRGMSCGYAGAVAHTTEGQGCIIGQALQSFGVPVEQLLEYDGENAEDVVARLTRPMPDDPYRLRWLECVQQTQDAGDTWENAVAMADNYAEVPA